MVAKKVIRYPEAYRAAIMRRQMAEQQQAQVETLNQQGAQEAVNQQLMQILLQQAATRQEKTREEQVIDLDRPLGVSKYLFGGKSPFSKTKGYTDLGYGRDQI
jgi:hypothetical protein